MSKRKIILLGICIVLALGLIGGSEVALAKDTDHESAPAMAYVVKDGKITWLLPDELTKSMTEEEYNKKFEMSAEAEAAIIHDIPPCPIIIDGVEYKPEEIHLFDGQRLGFTVGNDGKLYAFTTEEGMAKFQDEQGAVSSEPKLGSTLTLDIYSYFYEDWYYGGDYLAVPPGYPQGYIPDLGIPAIAMNDMISSLVVSSSASRMRLYEDANYYGDYFEKSSGLGEAWLFLYGWNDKASSIIVYN